MKKLLQISNYYIPDIGGIEKVAKAIADAVKDMMEVRVVCFAKSGENRTDVIDGAEIHRFKTTLKVASQQLSVSIIGEIKKQLREYDPDYVILHVPNPYLVWLTLKYLNGRAKFIVFWQSDIVKQKFGEKIFRRQTIRLLKRANRIVATSPNYIEGSQYLLAYREKCTVVPLCIDDAVLNPSEQVRKQCMEIRDRYAGKILLLAVGRHVPYKGIRYAIEAMDFLDERYELLVVGPEGASTSELKECKEKSKTRDRIEITGSVDNERLYAYMMACDIFCFPSITKNEAFGLSLAECMSYGKPAVTFTINGSGVNYVNLDGETGIEVENANVKAFADAISRLGEDEETRRLMGEAAGRRVRGMFVREKFDAVLISIIDELN